MMNYNSKGIQKITYPVLLIILASILFQAFLAIEYINFFPINGTFQAFNPFRRLDAGHLIGKDFHIYLGLGLTVFSYLCYLPFKLLGMNELVASIFSLHIICPIGFILTAYLVCRIQDTSREIALIIAGLVATMTIYLPVSSPDNSLLALRCLLPLLSLLVIRKLYPFNNMITMAGLGALAGFQVLWSPDFGIPCALSLTFIIIADQKINQIFSLNFLKKFSVYILSSIISLFFFGNLFTLGHFFEYLQFFASIGQDQMWYFLTGWLTDRKIFQLKDLPQVSYILCIAVLTVILLAHAKNKLNVKLKKLLELLPKKAIDNYCLIFILLAFLGGAYLPQVGGHKSYHYFYPLNLVINLLVASLFIKFLKVYLNFNMRLLSIGLTLVLAFKAFMLCSQFSLNINDNSYYYSQKLGTHLHKSYQSTEILTGQIEKDYQNIDFNIFSTYTTLLDYFLDKLSPAKSDYIIHALGKKTREEYLQTLIDTKPELVTTVNQEKILWGEWNIRVNWDFYRQLYSTYEPTEALWNIILFKPRTTPIPQTDLKLPFKVYRSRPNEVLVRIDVSKIVKKYGKVLFEAEIDYQATRDETIIPMIGKRKYIRVYEYRVAQPGDPEFTPTVMYGLAPGQKKIVFEASRDAAEINVQFTLLPENGSFKLFKFAPKVFYLYDQEMSQVKNIKKEMRDINDLV